MTSNTSTPAKRRTPDDMQAIHALAHRIASRYAHNSDPNRVEYTFQPHTLEQFVRAIEERRAS